ncbi:MAG: HEAT repeat protein [Myxococcota bacterium]|jgi:HEAT repeat protein
MKINGFRGVSLVVCALTMLLLLPAFAAAETALPLKANALIKKLDKAISADDSALVERIVRVLVVLGPRAHKSLKRALKRSDSARLTVLLDAVGRMAPKMRLLARPYLGHADAVIRVRAAAAIDGADARVLMAALASEHNKLAQYAIVRSIASSEEAMVDQFLAGQLQSPDAERRISGIQGLKARGSTGALADLYAALRDPQPLVRHAGIEAVAALGDVGAVRALLDLVSIEDDSRNVAAIWQAVKQMTGQQLPQEPDAWFRWLDSGT